jgi:hypothetical protein
MDIVCSYDIIPCVKAIGVCSSIDGLAMHYLLRNGVTPQHFLRKSGVSTDPTSPIFFRIEPHGVSINFGTPPSVASVNDIDWLTTDISSARKRKHRKSRQVFISPK